MTIQYQLFAMTDVLRAYVDADSEISNNSLYEIMGIGTHIPVDRQSVGKAEQKHSLTTRKVRWYQQTLKKLGLLEKVPGHRGKWRSTTAAKEATGQTMPGTTLLAFSTTLGIAIWARWENVFPKIDEPIHLCVTSPPYPLRKARAYGNPDASAYVDFICKALEHIVRCLVPGGSISLNISNDIFEPGSPARSLYRERLILALHDRLGLYKMDELIWHNASKPPGPIQWASKTRQQLNVAWEPVYVLTNNPHLFRGDNRRVLQPHTERQLKLIAGGGERRQISNSDGAYKIRQGSYGNATAGRIARNVLSFGHNCPSQKKVKEFARSKGFAPHGAPMPFSLADFLVRYLSKPGDLVVDPFAGSLTTAEAAERNGRRWLCTEQIAEYLSSAAVRFATSAA